MSSRNEADRTAVVPAPYCVPSISRFSLAAVARGVSDGESCWDAMMIARGWYRPLRGLSPSCPLHRHVVVPLRVSACGDGGIGSTAIRLLFLTDVAHYSNVGPAAASGSFGVPLRRINTEIGG